MDVMAADSQARRALVVEDERPIRELVRLHLELGGFAVDEAATARAPWPSSVPPPSIC